MARSLLSPMTLTRTHCLHPIMSSFMPLTSASIHNMGSGTTRALVVLSKLADLKDEASHLTPFSGQFASSLVQKKSPVKGLDNWRKRVQTCFWCPDVGSLGKMTVNLGMDTAGTHRVTHGERQRRSGHQT